MSTNSNIGILTENGFVDYIFCQFDGYVYIKRDNLLIEGVGTTLYKHYNDLYKIRLLLKFGDIEYLEDCPSKCKTLDDCIDYNEEGCYYTISLEEYNNKEFPLYKYLFKDEEWFVKYHKDDWVKVKDYKYKR